MFDFGSMVFCNHVIKKFKTKFWWYILATIFRSVLLEILFLRKSQVIISSISPCQKDNIWKICFANFFLQNEQGRKYSSRVSCINYYDKICVKHGHRLFISTCLLYCTHMQVGQDDPTNHLPAKIHLIITWHVQLTNHSLNTTQLHLKTTIEMTVASKHVI